MQWIGIPIIAAVPLLAIAGVFGERWQSAEASSATLTVSVNYPARFRVSISEPMTVRVTNRSAATLDTAHVMFDSTYVDRFSAVSFLPSSSESYVVPLTDLRPGESRHVRVELAAGRFGTHTGRIVVRGRADSTSIRIRTTVFP